MLSKLVGKFVQNKGFWLFWALLYQLVTNEMVLCKRCIEHQSHMKVSFTFVKFKRWWYFEGLVKAHQINTFFNRN